ncbi:hypothetical protein F4561_001404 [Lipingzhangella halophila]|uniref:Uncharacterized protein n=1 Tax=Lipingzhangella halophila TaxID=1783352 RepID=A0A7W7W2B2_9ACTN|nr:hypothetical protein [Lipingzhangella halophila]MBB4930584.1 hypothetical protein [Lipingzhangella halophila]
MGALVYGIINGGDHGWTDALPLVPLVWHHRTALCARVGVSVGRGTGSASLRTEPC